VSSALIDVPHCIDVDASYVGTPRTQAGTATYRTRAVLECLDIIGVLRDYRPPQPGETWLTPAASERRLLAQVNAILVLGPEALKQVTDLATDRDVPDAPRVFASVLVLGCTAGSNWVPTIADIFVRASERNTQEASAAAEACGLSPNTELDAALQRLCAHEHHRVRAGAVRALAFRGTLPEQEWHAASRDDAYEVVIAALQGRLETYDRVSCARALERWYGSENASVARSALRAGMTLRLPSTRAAAIEILRRDPAWADAAVCLAMFGHLSDSQLIREILAGPAVRAGVVAAAVLGSLELVPELLALSQHTDLSDDIRALAKQAVMTITAIPAADADSESLTTVWNERAPSLDARVRYRAGEPLTPALLAQALRVPHLSRRDRQETYIELLAMTESTVPRFSPYDFVGVQLQSLASIERWLSHGQSRTRDRSH
jgi:hypothetical protein